MRTHRLVPILLLVLAACGRGGDASDTDPGRVTVVATIHPVASIARAVGGDAIRVRTLLPPGAHPDTYEATPRMASALARADLIVRVGGPADAWVGETRGVETLVLTRGMRLRGEDAHDEAGTGNPHVWLDPVLVRDTLLPRLVDALVQAAPDSAAGIRDRARAYADSLTALDTEIRALLDGVARRRFAAAHPAWVYFADRYGLEEVGALHPSPGTELGSRELVDLVEAARASDVAAVIAEPQLGRAGTTALADELGVRVEVADPIGGEDLDGREDYLSLMRYNARAFARALSGAGS